MMKHFWLRSGIIVFVCSLLVIVFASERQKQGPAFFAKPDASAEGSVAASMERIREVVPARMKLSVQNLGSAMLASVSLQSSCKLVTPGAGESLGDALVQALSDNNGQPASFCVNPGVFDRDITLNGPVSLILTPGIYPQTKPIVLSGTGASVIGQNAGSTVLVFEDGLHGANIQISSGATSFKVSGLTLSREIPGTQEGDNGIRTSASVDLGLIERLTVSNQYDGLYLTVTSYTQIQNLFVTNNQRTGIVMTNVGFATNGTCQYYLSNILLSMNNGYGMYVSPDGGPMSIGNWDGILTFGNKAGGLMVHAYSGTQIVSGVRLANSFFGQDGETGGGSEIRIQGGGMHTISDTFVEIGGVSATVPNQSHADVAGIYIGSGVTSAQLNAVYVSGNTGDGIVIEGTNVMITASSFIDNGINANVNDYKSGILVSNPNSKVMAGVSQFVNSGHQLTAIKSSSANVTLFGNSYDTNGGAQGYVGP